MRESLHRAGLALALGALLVVGSACSGETSGSSAGASASVSAGASAVVAATNAMLQPGDVGGALAAPADMNGYSTGFLNSPDSEDLPSVCFPGPDFNPVNVPSAEAVAFFAQSGLVWQFVYQYGSDADAQQAWQTLSADIENRCVGESMGEDGVITFESIPAEQSAGVDRTGWGVLSDGAYSTVYVIGDSIQHVSFRTGMDEQTYESLPMPSEAPGAARELSVELAQRWINRASEPITQNQVVTRAVVSMLQPGDVPSSLPVAVPSNWEVSDFIFQQPELMGNQAFSASVGSPGGNAIETGEGGLSQDVLVYVTSAAAEEGWEELSQEVASYSEGQGQTGVGGEGSAQGTSGVSELSFAGVPGLWVRDVRTYEEGEQTYSQESYTIFLFMGDAIQSVSYAIGRAGSQSEALDEAAVNQLAEVLANRWVAAGAQ